MSADARAEHLCSFGSGPGRSWTDIYTNHTFIAPLHPSLGVSDIVEGRMPPFALPHFLHEVTHHTCLNSPVGIAMTALSFRARALAESEESLPEARMYDLRVHTLLTLYRPLFEGLALFAEFDAIPAFSRVATQPMHLALDLFVREAAVGKGEQEMFQELFKLLSGHRLTGDVVERKTSLLSEPLDSRDGYLVGYLVIKCFGTWAALVDSQFEDPDLALGYAIYHFFYDYELVDQLLSPTESDPREITALVSHLVGRLEALFSSEDVSGGGEQLEEALLAFQPDTTATEGLILAEGSALDNDPAVVERGRRALIESVESLPYDVQGQLARRSLLHLSSIPVTVTFRDDSFIASHEGGPLAAGPVDRAYVGREDVDGSLDVFYESVTRSQGVAVSVVDVVIWRTFRGQDEEFLTRWLEQFVVAREHVVRAADSELARFEATVAQEGWDEARRDVASSLLPYRQEAYTALAFPWLPEERRGDFLAAAADRGARGAIDPSLVRSLAVLSMLDGTGAYLEEVSWLEGSSSSLPADCDAIRATLADAFGGTPLLLQPLDEDGVERTRVRSFV